MQNFRQSPSCTQGQDYKNQPESVCISKQTSEIKVYNTIQGESEFDSSLSSQDQIHSEP